MPKIKGFTGVYVAHSSAVSAAQIQARRDALLAAERSGMMEGLPPASLFARQQGELYALGQVTADEAVAAVILHYSAQATAPKDSK